MEAMTEPSVEELPLEECWALLDSNAVGRLAVDIAGWPDIFPINYVVDAKSIVFRTGAGTKLAGAVLNRHVAFEIDGYLPGERCAWSVVVKGNARQIESMNDRYRAEDLPLYPWVVSDKPDFVLIDPTEVTGRRFRVASDVAPDASIGWTPPPASDVGPGDGDDIAVRPAPGVPYHEGDPHLRPS